MRVALTQQDESLEQLATRVYGLEKPSAADLRTATTTLSEANPFLRKPDDVPPGTLLTVPDTHGLVGGEAAAPVVAGIGADQLRGAIALVHQQLTGDIDAEITDAKASAKLARSTEVKAVGRKAGGLGDELRKLATAAEARAEDARTLKAYQAEAFSRIQSDLDELLGVLGS